MLATVEFDGNTIMPTSTAKTSSQVGQLVSTAEEYTSYRRGFCVKWQMFDVSLYDIGIFDYSRNLAFEI